MKVVAFNGSSRKEGNTFILLNTVLDELKKEDVQTEIVSLSGETLSGCKACYKCFQNKNKLCASIGDIINECIEKILYSDAILLGSPTYFSDVSANMKAFIERCGMVSRANGDIFRRKLGASVVAVRRAGATSVFSSMNYFFLIGQMIVVGSNYWNIGIGKDPGDVKNDLEGMQTMKTLGQNILWLLKKIHS